MRRSAFRSAVMLATVQSFSKCVRSDSTASLSVGGSSPASEFAFEFALAFPFRFAFTFEFVFAFELAFAFALAIAFAFALVTAEFALAFAFECGLLSLAPNRLLLKPEPFSLLLPDARIMSGR